MSTVAYNTVEDTVCRHDVNGYQELTMGLVISGLDMTASPFDRMLQIQAVIPTEGTVHPFIDNLWMHEWYIPRGEGADTFRVNLRYRNWIPIANSTNPESLTVTNDLIDIQTFKKRDGTPITIVYPAGTAAQAITAPVTVKTPVLKATFARPEATTPFTKSQFYTGQVNSMTWFGGSEGQWLCTGIDFFLPNLQYMYQVSYQFLFNVQTWLPYVWYVDPNTGKRPINQTDVALPWYYETDFNDLGL